MRQETRTQIGKINMAMPDGSPYSVEVPLTIIDTYHDDGRKDVMIKVPQLSTGAKKPEGG